MDRLTGERRALAAAVLAFYTFLHFLVALMPPPGWGTCYWALTAVYGLGFFALVAGYFWARWYAMGLGLYGAVVGIVGLFYLGWEPILVFYGGTHLGAAAVLFGSGMAKRFDGRQDWRQRFHLDEDGVNRLGKAVLRLGLSLPFMITYALAPKEGMGSLALLGVGLAGAGLWGLVRMRSWGVLALVGSAGAVVGSLFSTAHLTHATRGWSIDLLALGTVSAILVAAAAAPFVVPMARYVIRGDQEEQR
jgi:hypothetical protein